jgi:hypothetical protein
MGFPGRGVPGEYYELAVRVSIIKGYQEVESYRHGFVLQLRFVVLMKFGNDSSAGHVPRRTSS